MHVVKKSGLSILVPGSQPDQNRRSKQGSVEQYAQSGSELQGKGNRSDAKTSFEALLFSEDGIDSLQKYAGTLKLDGSQGKEISDLQSILCVYSEFLHEKFPKKARREVLDSLLKLSDVGLKRISSSSYDP